MSTSFTDWKSDLYLAHHGILGMKWGVRRFQNKDGTLTEEGKVRYGERGNDAYRSDVHKNMRQLRKGLSKETGADMVAFNGQSNMDDIRINKGGIAKRLSSMSKENEEGSTYTTSTIVFDRGKTLKQVGSKKLDSRKMKFIKDITTSFGLGSIKNQKIVDQMYNAYKKNNDFAAARDAAVKAYKKEHPNSKLTDQQIYANLFYT